MASSPPSWSAQYVVSHIPKSSGLPGDKVLLPPSALEKLLSVYSGVNDERSRQQPPHYDPYSSTSFSSFQRAESQYQDHRQPLPQPLTFRLVNPVNGKAVYAGVREFSADEGQVILSPFLLQALGIDSSTKGDTVDDTTSGSVTVHVKQLPKGTFVKLRPLEAGYDPEDWKALLEQHLRANYTTLTSGEILAVPGARRADGKREEFKFLVDGIQPEGDGICIVDTDLEVDIEALDEEQARETLKRIAEKLSKAPGTDQGSSPGGALDIFKPQHGQVLPGEYVDYELGSWDKAHALVIELGPDDDESDLDLFVSPLSTTQRAKPRLDEHVFADFDGPPTKRIRLEPTNAELEKAESLFVAVHAYATTANSTPSAVSQDTAPIRFSLRAHHPTTPAAIKESTAAPPWQTSDVQCKNCQQWVPKQTLVLHENVCLRNNILCPQGCGHVFQKRSPLFQSHWHCPHDSAYGNTPSSHEKHNNILHPAEVLRCADCSTAETFPHVPALAHHRTTTCPAKLILCRFCHLIVPQDGDPDVPSAEVLLSGMTQHELLDGARTTECHMCGKIIRLRDMDTHSKSHDLDRLSRPAPQPCRNVNCGRTLDSTSKTGDTRAGSRMGQGHGNEIGLCSVCFGPLYVSLYDPENKALRRRVERRYLQQLLTGCGKPWCRNEFCKNGRTHLELPANITTKDALPLIKPFVDGSIVPHGGSSLHFCVDEPSQRRRTLAEMLAAEDGGPTGNGGYTSEWCIGALEAESGDLEAARQWLKNWAPTRQEHHS